MPKQVYLWLQLIHVFLLPISSSISNSYLNDTEPAIVTRWQCISKEGQREKGIRIKNERVRQKQGMGRKISLDHAAFTINPFKHENYTNWWREFWVTTRSLHGREIIFNFYSSSKYIHLHSLCLVSILCYSATPAINFLNHLGNVKRQLLPAEGWKTILFSNLMQQ